MMPPLLRRLLPSHTRNLRREAARQLLPGPLTNKPRSAARAHIEGTVSVPGFADVQLEDGRLPWETLDGLPRAHLRQLHGHAVLRDLVHAHRRTQDKAFLAAAVELVEDWIAANPWEAPSDRMAWHDETTAMRVKSWLLLREELLGTDHPWVGQLEAALIEHAELLADDLFHTSGTNHGMFQDEALVTYASLVPQDTSSKTYFMLGTRRLLEYLDLIVTSDGVHREHSPSYHSLIAGKVKRLAMFYADAGEQRTSEHLGEMCARMERYATHVIKPDGSFPLVGDTFSNASPNPGLFESPAYRWAATRGQDGARPSERNVVFPDSGYAIFRDAWRQDGGGTYVHFTAAYHTDYHKHTDDLSVWVYHDGDLLTEAGPNGYDYADPYTIYGYSAHAHNTLLIDGESLPRVDDRTDEVRLVSWDLDGEPARATGRNGRFDAVVHVRTVEVFESAPRIVVHDHVTSETEHLYTFLWNCAPGVVPEQTADGIILRRDGRAVASLTTGGAPIETRLHHGDIEARRGFRLGGGPPEPTWTIELVVPNAQGCNLTHEIVLQ